MLVIVSQTSSNQPQMSHPSRFATAATTTITSAPIRMRLRWM